MRKNPNPECKGCIHSDGTKCVISGEVEHGVVACSMKMTEEEKLKGMACLTSKTSWICTKACPLFKKCIDRFFTVEEDPYIADFPDQ